MKYSYDLHVHTALSPCADNDMTPNDIAGMAYLNGIDILAVTDHNSAANAEAVIKAGSERNILVVPGLEVESVEGVHIICLFPDAGKAMAMSQWVYEHLPDIPNNEAIFGCQYLFGEKDEIIGDEKRMLIMATELTSEEVFRKAYELDGCAFFAHVERKNNGVLSVLGVFPEDIDTGIIEVNDSPHGRAYAEESKLIGSRRILFNSDAHTLVDINEAVNFLDLPWSREELDAAKVVKWIKDESQWNLEK